MPHFSLNSKSSHLHVYYITHFHNISIFFASLDITASNQNCDKLIKQCRSLFLLGSLIKKTDASLEIPTTNRSKNTSEDLSAKKDKHLLQTMHCVGKIGISDVSILSAPLTSDDVMNRHWHPTACWIFPTYCNRWSSRETILKYTDMRRLTTEIRFGKYFVRRFCRCAYVIECTYTNLESTV